MPVASDPQAALRAFAKTRDFFVGIDSDGCVFDTMEVKHKECFIPNIIKYFGLAAVSKYAREASEFVNLYSKFRGINRFPALTEALDLLEHRPEVRRRPSRSTARACSPPTSRAACTGWMRRTAAGCGAST